MKLMVKFTCFMAIAAIVFAGCKKDNGAEIPQGNVTIGITDLRADAHKAGDGIIDASKLTKFEITISRIELRKAEGAIVEALTSEVAVDLRNYKGNVKEFPGANVPIGNYTGVIIYFSGVSTTYDGNNYTASTSGEPTLTIGGTPVSAGIINAFENEFGVDITFDFQVSQDQTTAFNISIDAVGTCYEIEYGTAPNQVYFAGLRPIIEYHTGLYFEEGIQQIKYSPPMGIQYNGGTTASYYGIHTFKDFNGIGGNITEHASQHVYRGTDGALAIEIGAMLVNSTDLRPSKISATGTTDVEADEIFNFADIASELEGTVTFEAGKTYYFSLKKIWTITSGSTKYTIQRMCEPIPVVWPVLP